MIDVYKCGFCGIGVEFNTEDMEEHNEFECCRGCFESESDTGEIY
ncbi:hypothetical protein [Aquibacillus saliphilus]|nr:hypothetical protein [Aquibacillus saliphilus]